MALYAQGEVVDESSLVQPAALSTSQSPEPDENTSLLAKHTTTINTAEQYEPRDDKRSQNVSFLSTGTPSCNAIYTSEPETNC